jgi:hypothetical protein
LQQYYREGARELRAADISFTLKIDAAAAEIGGSNTNEAVEAALAADPGDFRGKLYVNHVRYRRGKGHLNRTAQREKK